ncbi:bifunctional DNA-formamidopyrimidine glycosylase/DNA-(apurinic or apyrimidinic site) lyase [Dehalococcoidia bacterium]|nr:bifunctional DNA-formamidopyrimidine glycosylase/DNA-(apurinic or apyrimidinic site) lyase [Dehalococcoidia bacterium]MCL0047887.1 bifunctional DNA-formamidopyrimidine glycosylase/DNA-(apurinic or apyrimidinic site) lyase [Dehalococcoidia bacterium]MCL0064460.1 bifunctional DNA-formamidopyrimidine glycosylase/DNA-(apurinic or apyrimidinic site) lyase [Dehalococcoidia bacterium]
MPELPEVETIKNELAPQVTGHRLVGVDLLWPKAVHEPSPEAFCQRLIGQEIMAIWRRGKYLLFQLCGGQTLILHLKMSGVLLLRDASCGPENHTSAIFRLDGDNDLHFVDPRRFGSMWLTEDQNRVIGKLGIEPLGPSFTPAVLGNLLSPRRVAIKVLLCDQHAIAGMGNMYADEALFAARIHPLRKANALSTDEIKRLHRGIVKVLQGAIKRKGASISTYRRPDGGTGKAHLEFQVAHRRGESCPNCGFPIQRVSLRGRGTHFCARCQPDGA